MGKEKKSSSGFGFVAVIAAGALLLSQKGCGTEIGIGKAVRASSSFPAMFCPCEFKNHMFMDGGVLDNIPVIPLKRMCNKKIMAVNFYNGGRGGGDKDTQQHLHPADAQ
jgi:predicted acylesterase/phospholipase RssA